MFIEKYRLKKNEINLLKTKIDKKEAECVALFTENEKLCIRLEDTEIALEKAHSQINELKEKLRQFESQ